MIEIRDDLDIYCTRGDSTSILGNEIEFSFEDENGNLIDFLPGQKVIFKVYNPKNVKEVFIQKEITVDEICSTVSIPLTTEDTSFGDFINKPVVYTYEISIDGCATIIGYDQDTKPKFVLLPEGGIKQ